MNCKRLAGLMIMMHSCAPAFGQMDAPRVVQPPGTAADSANTQASSPVVTPVNPPATPASVPAAAQPAKKPQPKTVTTKTPSGYSMIALLGSGVAGILIGAAGMWFMNKRRGGNEEEETGNDNSREAAQGDDGGFVSQWKAEQEMVRLTDLNKKLLSEGEQLRRENAELEQLLKTSQNPVMTSIDHSREVIFYMPQPNMNGRFQEASKRPDAANALYAFRLDKENTNLASFEFIAQDAYLNAAIGNEPTWIAVACDRTNQPSGTTSRVKTESPGRAILKNGEWEITRKARITYL
jgi:hypothetical protein